MLFWIALVASVTYSIALPGEGDSLFNVGPIEIYSNDLLLVAALALGTNEFLRSAGAREPSRGRTVSRILIAYLAYQLLVVIPVALWLGDSSFVTVVRAMAVRFDWLFFPVMLTLFRDERMRRTASGVLLAAAVVLALWGVYLALTGGGGFYWEAGEGMRYRILPATSPPIFLWPLAIAVSGLVQAWPALGFGALAVIGLTLAGFRSGYVAAAVAATTGLVTSGRLWRVVMWAIPVGLLLLVLYMTLGPKLSAVYGYTLGRLLDLQSSTAIDRFTRWQLSWDFIRNHPFNDYVWTWSRYAVRLSGDYEPHNFVLEIGTNEGIAGFAFYGALLFALARTSWQRVWHDAETRALSCFLIGYAVFCAANTNWYSYSSMPLLVAVIAGLVARLDQLHDRDAEANRASSDSAIDPTDGPQPRTTRPVGGERRVDARYTESGGCGGGQCAPASG
jgi:O-antigen ligase